MVHGQCSHARLVSPSPAPCPTPSWGESHNQNPGFHGFVAEVAAISAGSIRNEEAGDPRFLRGRLNNKASRVLNNYFGFKLAREATKGRRPWRGEGMLRTPGRGTLDTAFPKAPGEAAPGGASGTTDQQFTRQGRPSAKCWAGQDDDASPGDPGHAALRPSPFYPLRAPFPPRGRDSAKFSSFRFASMAVSLPGCRPGQGKRKSDEGN